MVQQEAWRIAVLQWWIQQLRAQNDGDLDATKTAHFRGRIAELKALQALADDLPDIQ